ncbi:uncharacterized protein E0L32_001930 [Thyridium curvatum]|uniref:mannan endo-1,6-alpha-mannosidase n=1 Tax=Thyridium curvatum TaxID=1093900 RepID=A0A507AP07_9PEZI|nr:uncharacterized protein E0L32_001749 [Thyridium curvatum]XP_030990066.1 uncharacterized protein E0L32_001930 [Thyridium curvatum]TPX08174.1 hypothetical protein E0L32_001749 [Thyridium curvatum]TPX08355.1 hypothetical protein E0L32_001930 [Thyridium curvatum]
MIDYQFLTGDTSYSDTIMQALQHQVGDSNDFMPGNQTRTEGNDDQGFWAMAAMSAAENKFPDPPADKPQWLALAQAVVHEYMIRWDTEKCNGGLRWQIFPFNQGFNYKNSISNGCFFNLAARLARFTGNQTYAEWAEKVWDWEASVGLIDGEFRVFDGAGVDNDLNCTKHDTIQWSYNAGIFLHGAAVMYNLTGGDPRWRARVDGVWNETRSVFFTGGADKTILVERACEAANLCNVDQQSFKGYLTRWMAGTTQMAPYTFDQMMPLIRRNAVAAAAACTGSTAAGGFKGAPGTACGFKWTPEAGGFDGLVGVGAQMNALDAIMYSLVSKQSAAPVTSTTGGTSKGDENAGQKIAAPMEELAPITTGDKVAAAFATTAIVFSVIGGSVFVML